MQNGIVEIVSDLDYIHYVAPLGSLARIMPRFILCYASYYAMFHIMVYGFHIMISGFHIMFRAQWKYYNATWDVACSMMPFWPQYHSMACMHT